MIDYTFVIEEYIGHLFCIVDHSFHVVLSYTYIELDSFLSSSMYT